jgi:2'-5' RNA ligase
MNTDCMIAFLPTDISWCQQDFPHMTLVYGGPIANRSESDFNAMAKDALSAARLTGPFSLNVTGVEQLGTEPNVVDALMLYPTPQLLLARQIVQKWNGSEFTQFVPHATIGPAGSAEMPTDPWPANGSMEIDGSRWPGLPASLYFNRVVTCWGDRRVIFNMTGMY